MPDCASIDRLVTPYVDGELASAEHDAVADHLRACPPCRARALVEQAVRDLVHIRQRALQHDRASDLLRTKCASHSKRSQPAGGADASATRRRGVWRTLAPLAMAASLVLVIGGASIYQITENSTRVMAAELAADHVKCFLLQEVSGREQAVGPVEYALAAKFGPVRLPERPDRAALELIGQRTCLYGQGRIAHVMYRHHGRPVSLFMLPKAARKEEMLDTLGHEAAVWSVGDRTFVLIAREPKADFDRMAVFVRAGLH